MKFNFVLSLQHLTLAKISIALCNNSEIKSTLEANRSFEPCESHGLLYAVQEYNYFSMLESSRYPIYADDLLKQVQDKVGDMISPLNLGAPIVKKILSFIPHIVQEIQKWELDHSEVLPAVYDVQHYFCWKSVGTIDRESTAENLLNHGNLSVKNQFFLACLYCMKISLSSLWDGIYDSYKAHMFSNCQRGSLLHYWITHLDGFHYRGFVFADASHINNVSALQYFYNECRGEEEKQALLNDVLNKHWENLDLVRFCVSKLCENHHGELTSSQCRNILRCFLKWPMQSLFLDTSEYLLVKLDQVGLNDLLLDILKIIITHEYEDIDYLDLLKELWGQIPSHRKDSLLNTREFQPIQTALQQTSAKLLTPEWFHQL